MNKFREERFGEYLSQIRRRRRKKLRELSEYLNLSVGYLSEIEHGIKNPPANEVIQKIANYFELGLQEVEELLALAQKEKSKPQKDPEVKDFFKSRGEAAMIVCREANKMGDDEFEKFVKDLIGKRKKEN
jgi:transcriptional regulator with XRE-family HTH domain